MTVSGRDGARPSNVAAGFSLRKKTVEVMAMHCRQAHEWINLWIDNQLTADQQAQVQQHLEACPQCRQLAERWLRAREALRNYPSIKPSADFDARVWQAIAQRQQPVWTPSPVLRIATSAAMGMLIAVSLLAVMWWHTPRPQAPSPVLWLGGREAKEWAQLLLGTEGGDRKWQDGSSSRSLLPFCLWWRS